MSKKIKLWCCTHDTRSKEEETFAPEELGFKTTELEAMTKETEKDLDFAARDFFYEEKQPEWGYEIVDSEDT